MTRASTSGDGTLSPPVSVVKRLARKRANAELCAGERLSKFKSQTNGIVRGCVAKARERRRRHLSRVEDEGKRSDVEEGNDEGGGEKKEREKRRRREVEDESEQHGAPAS